MEITDYQSQFLACALTRRYPSDSPDRLAGAVASAEVDLNPHQVDAALFAFRSPLSNGALLADEVGLGKTIEAGLVIAQRWAERRRRILVITPANLRKQWIQELQEKFALPGIILESQSYNKAVKEGNPNPFDSSAAIALCSYQFAKIRADEVKAVPWDLVVMDEAHRLRNVYKPNNVIANALKTALQGKNKLLLTATPLQNSLLELYGLISFIDERTFGDLDSFRDQFGNLGYDGAFEKLRDRLRPICHRTLRRDVTAYIKYTSRVPLTHDFTPKIAEDELYDKVSEYLQRDNLQALPASQRTLITLVLRKLLASSTFAIAGALQSMSNRLKAKLGPAKPAAPVEEELEQDYEAYAQTAEEWQEGDPEPLTAANRAAIEREIADLDSFIRLAESIGDNAKGTALLEALKTAFGMAAELGAAKKAIIFTESRRTQNYLLELLSESDFAEGIVLFNGTNTDPRSREILNLWLTRHKGTDRVTGSRTADMRSALVDYFREEGQIMIATEAGAEGINLQFCSLVVNYDLPWNPQRIEQRIGRCHRYGQKHDVVVVNFLNQKNAADKHVYELLDEKFKLFSGVFGASDEVLGSIESGVDFEKRIVGIYQRCRKPEEIQTAFEALQRDLSAEIDVALNSTRKKLLENFDVDVSDRLKTRKLEAEDALTRVELQLMQLTRHELEGYAQFTAENSFYLNAAPFGLSEEEAPVGAYELPRRTPEAHIYRLNHPLALEILNRARGRSLPEAEVTIRYCDFDRKISTIHELVGTSGWLSLSLFTIEALDQVEDHLISCAMTERGQVLEREVADRFFMVPWRTGDVTAVPADVAADLDRETVRVRESILSDVTQRNAEFFAAETEKLEGWADDLKQGLEKELKDIERQIKEVRRKAAGALSLESKLGAQKQIRELESLRSTKRRTLFDAQDAVDAQRGTLIAEIEKKLAQAQTSVPLFKVRWNIV